MLETPRKLSRRQFLNGMAVTAGTAALSACVAPVPSGAPAAGSEPAAEVRQLSFMNWDVVADTPFQTMLDLFMEKSGIQVDIQATPTDDYGTKLRTVLSAGTAPDVFRVDDDDVRGFSLEGQFLDLTPWWEQSDLKVEDYFERVFLFPQQPEGNFTAWSIGNQPRVIYYNLEMFDAAGVPYPPSTWTCEGWTFDDFLETAKQLTIEGEQWGALIYDDAGYEQTFLVNGGVPDGRFSKDGLEFTMASEQGISVVQWVADLTCVHKVQPEWSLLQVSNAGNQLFVSSQVAMIFRTFGTTTYFRNNVTDFVWDVAPVPCREAQTCETSMIVFASPASTQNGDLAWELYEYMNSLEGATVFAENSAFVPAHRAAAAKLDSGDQPPANVKLFLDAAENSTNVNFSNYTSRARSLYRPQMDLVWTCQDTAENVLTAVKAEVENVLAGN